jgi:hypothetical protein
MGLQIPFQLSETFVPRDKGDPDFVIARRQSGIAVGLRLTPQSRRHAITFKSTCIYPAADDLRPITSQGIEIIHPIETGDQHENLHCQD